MSQVERGRETAWRIQTVYVGVYLALKLFGYF